MTVVVVAGDLPVHLAEQLEASAMVAVDTETSGLDWQKDRLEICQVSSVATGPVVIRDIQGTPERLAGVLANPSVLKVFHFAPFDLRFLESQWAARVTSLACTKAASRLLDPGLPASEHSLQSLLQRHLGVAITKGAVRTSDWGAPSLSAEQLDYAAADVTHLIDLYHVMRRSLEELGRVELFEHVCAYMPIDAHLAVTRVPNPLVY